MSDKPEVKEESLEVPDQTIINIKNILQALINIQLEYSLNPVGNKLMKIDIPYIRGFINVKIGLLGSRSTVAHPDTMICIGHIVIK